MRLGLGMLFLQFAIGIANDLADAEADAIAKPAKPIPAGLLARRHALVALGLCGVLGMLAAASVGLAAATLGIVGLSDGLAYDLRLKGTVLSWVPFSAGVALLPVYAWVGATGSWPGALWGILILGLLAGVTLALANSLSDLEKDRGTGVRSIAVALGRERTFTLDAALMLGVQAIAAATVPWSGADARSLAAGIAGACVAWTGVGLAASGNDRPRQAGWEVQAIGIVVLGAAWLAALSTTGALTR